MPKYKAYVVIVGTEPGVYRNWVDVSQRIMGVPGASYQGFKEWEVAQAVFEDAYARGMTRVVKLPPPEARVPRAQQWDEKQEGQPRPTGAQARPPGAAKNGSTASSGLARYTLIAAALEEVKRERQNGHTETAPCAEARPGGVPKASSANANASMPTNASASAATASSQLHRAATPASPPSPAPLPIPQKQTVSHLVEALRNAAQGVASEGKAHVSSTSSSPPTQVTQTRNVFSSEYDSPETSSPRYAQSLSYASSPASSTVGLDNPSIASSDGRTHLSSPSSVGTRYFPEDWLARQAQIQHDLRGTNEEKSMGAQSPGHSSAKYAAALSNLEAPNAVLEGEEACSPATNRNVVNPTNSSDGDAVSLRQTNAQGTPTLRTSQNGSPQVEHADAIPATAISSSSSDAVLDSTRASDSASLNSVSTVTPSRPKSKLVLSRSYSEASIQTNTPVQQREFLNGFTQHTPPGHQHTVVGEASQSPSDYAGRVRSMPLRATASVSSIPVHHAAPAEGAACACEHPEHACLLCGLRPRTVQSAAAHGSLQHSPAPEPVSGAPQAAAPTAPPMAPRPAALVLTPTLGSPNVTSAATLGSVDTISAPASASEPESGSGQNQSLRSSTGGNTPLMGPSEASSHRWFCQTWADGVHADVSFGMSFTETARGADGQAEGVVHNVRLDPRSPIQRGTSIPGGSSSSQSAVRPSPAIVPMDSLLFAP